MFANRWVESFGLSRVLARSEFKLMNEGTWLGVFWYLLNPLLTFLLLLNIFQDRLGHGIPNYPLYLLLGIVMFHFFQKVSSECVSLVRGRKGLINALGFPYEALVGGVALKFLFVHVFEMLVLMGFLWWFGIPFALMLFYPLVFVLLFLFSVGAGLFLSAVGAYVFDLGNAWGFIVRLIWFGTPIFYDIGGQGTLQALNLFNPMYYLITVAREVIIYGRIPEAWLVLGAVGFALLSLLVGWFVFKRLEGRFAEIV